MREKISIEEQVKKLHGLQTIESISDTNKISKKSAINLVSKLKKKGYVAYYSAGRNKRIYSISPIKPKFKESLYEFINKTNADHYWFRVMRKLKDLLEVESKRDRKIRGYCNLF